MLVTVISPCYNVSPYIGRFLESLLNQTYKKLEVILVNDGSTDNTGDIIKSFLPRLEAQGYKVIYQEQENAGQSSAVNNALKLVTGEFLTWPDPDDWLTPDSIEKRVAFLQEHPEVGMVRCAVEKIEDGTGASLGFMGMYCERPSVVENAFHKFVFCQTWFAPLAYMVRMSFLDRVVENREIYVSKRAGQNWQLMLPMAKVYPFWQMPEVLGYYCVRNNSHSNGRSGLNEKLAYSFMSEDVLISTLQRMNADAEIIHDVKSKYALYRYDEVKEYGSYVQGWSYYKSAIKVVDKGKVRLTVLLILPPFVVRCFYRLLRVLRRLIMK
ncbi:MAG: glycosyltransferase family A protein [Akkermansia sp.]|nr:glycosyltransferase family A protein [Akkermansia sp.]